MKGQIRKALSGFYYIESEGTTYQTRARGNFRNRKITPWWRSGGLEKVAI